CGFIEKYTPVHLPSSTIVGRYTVADPFLQFYFKFIDPNLKNIQSGDYVKDPTRLLQDEPFARWLGFSFERFCRRHHRLWAKMLGFDAVKYKAGAFFTRGQNRKKRGFQI